MRNSPDFKLFGQFQKAEEQTDGTLKVYGICSSESKDSQGDVILASAMEKAIPDYLKFPAVREMHQATTAAGRALEISVEDDNQTHFCAHVTDPIAVMKVKTGTYNGFSIGGKVLKRDSKDKSIITAISLAEVSLVDRPANPDSIFQLIKFDTGGAMSTPETITKGLDQVSWAANILQSLKNLQESCEFEASQEGDSSPVPAAIAAQVKAFGDTLKLLVAEEVAELVGVEAPAEVVVAETTDEDSATEETKENSDMTGDLAKKAVQISKANKEKLMELHKVFSDAHEDVNKAFKAFTKAHKEACDKLAAFGADEEADSKEDPKAEEDAKDEPKAEDKPKPEAKPEERPEDKKEEPAKKEDAEKSAQSEDLKKVLGDMDLLKAELAALKAQPNTPKVISKATAVDKSDDVLGKASVPSAPLTGEAAELALMKAAFSKPLARL